jgi:membrane carboxypeptidase/penicillin-binding protein
MEERRESPRKRKGLITFAVIMAVLFCALAAVAWWPIRHARAEWRAGRVAEAIVQGNRWSALRLWPNQYRELLAAAHLSAGNSDAGRLVMQRLRGKTLWFSAMPKPEVANRLFARGGYEDYLAYDAAVRTLFDGDEAALYRAAALAGVNRVRDAEATLREIDRDDVTPEKLRALERALTQRKEGIYPYVADRDGQTIASYHLANRDVVAVNTDFAPIIEKEAGRLTIENQAQRLGANDVIETTLAASVQKAAMSALSGFRGSLVAIDPRTNELLAVASTRGGGPLANLALEHSFEPGSVVKVLTGLSAFANHLNLDPLFPYTCTGELLVDGRHFGDWLTTGHGVLADFDEAMAQSCNVVFADIGIRLGRDRLRQLKTRAGFDGQTDLGLFKAPLGRTVGKIHNNFETGFYAIGIEHETTTTLHMAMLASMLANRGTLTSPRLIRARRSILGEVLEQPPQQGSARVVDRATAERIIKSMVAVVTRPKGTGRRANVHGLSLALKTGTAGQRESGYHAVIIGFAPVEQPRIAFAIFADDAGPAEYAGAKIVHDFLTNFGF